MAGFGLTFISGLLLDQRFWLRLIGGAFLCYLGIKTFLERPVEQAAAVKSAGLAGAYASTLFLTLTNPTTIFSFAAIFAGLGVANTGGNYAAAGLLVLGVFLGSALWWFILSGAVSLLRSKLGARQLRWVNCLSGVIMLAFGALAFASLLGG